MSTTDSALAEKPSRLVTDAMRRPEKFRLVSGHEVETAIASGLSDRKTIKELHFREAVVRRSLMATDAVAAIGAALLTAWIGGVMPTLAIVLCPTLATLLAKVQGLYDRDDVVIHNSGVDEWRPLFLYAALTSFATYLAWRLVTTAHQGGGVRILVLLILSMFLLDLIGRAVARAGARAITPAEQILIVGNPARCVQLAHNLRELPGVALVGTVANASLTGSLEDLAAVIGHLHVHRLIVVPVHDQPETETLELIKNAKTLGVRVSLMPTIMAVVGGSAAFDDVHGLTLLGVPRFGLSRSSAALKRGFDMFGAAIGLLLALPLLAALGAAVKLDSRGPVMFRQVRVGRDGRHFEILKLRTMVDGAEAMKAGLQARNEATNGLFKMSEDPRVTRIGRRLRTAHVDELPQLINVLKGDMSLVGPRPLIVEEDALLTAASSERLRLTPGITGPWQIRGPMNASVSEMARLDYLYISHWSIWSDLDILLRTAQRVLERAGH